ncbi:MAG TPA: hypothetical protein DEF85_01565 [Clostridiaceae bacterium]|nr:hypothetical protein [Clostridiaceae bacterium]
MKNLFKKAHKMAREMKEKYPEVDYHAQFGLCISFLLEEKEEEEMDNTITFNEIKKMAEEEGLEAALWEKYNLTKIYFNHYTGSGYRKSKGQFDIQEDGTILVNKKGIYTKEVENIWLQIPEGAKLVK